MEVKGCSKRNLWHFCENTVGTVWNGVIPALRCLDIMCLFILSFRLKDFSQTEQNQLKSTPQEQNVDWEGGNMLRFYIGFQVIKIYCFPSTTTTFLLFSSSTTTTATAPHFYCFPSTTTTATTTTFLLFSLHHHHHHHISIVFPPPPPPPPPHFYCFPSTTTTTTFLLFYSTTVNKRLQTTIISSVCRNVSSCQEQSWFSSILSCLLPSATVSFTDRKSTTTTCISPSLIQYT